jgi:hypothetical protein
LCCKTLCCTANTQQTNLVKHRFESLMRVRVRSSINIARFGRENSFATQSE